MKKRKDILFSFDYRNSLAYARRLLREGKIFECYDELERIMNYNQKALKKLRR